MTAPVLLHIGFHKTGTTWLQNRLFAPEHGWQPLGDRHELRRTLIFPRELEYDRRSVEAAVAADLDAARSAALTPVISDERLSGHPHSGGHDSTKIADRLLELFPEGRVLIVVREQRAMARACWSQYVQVGGTHRLEAYLDPVHDGMVPLFAWEHLAYDRLVARYQDLFGATAVRVLPFELFVQRPDEFLDLVYSHAGANRVASSPSTERLNPSLSAFRLQAKRWGNVFDERPRASTSPRLFSHRIWRRVSVAIDLGAARAPRGLEHRADTSVRSTVDRACRGRFEESNRRLEALSGLDLGEFGYAR